MEKSTYIEQQLNQVRHLKRKPLQQFERVKIPYGYYVRNNDGNLKTNWRKPIFASKYPPYWYEHTTYLIYITILQYPS